ncbi:hypothetical protein PF010_g22509 [Phytophthora fragariae]|uniref:Uncharacterized protein n=1 Tax=Phytophthora fragariae TaxID=53985 RepID=A0A6A3IWA0_9STRA|nr:hypothetical protein PF011_g20819 [Phytophthora fragariae]KAE9080107.1 hypothetical protein PF010_g22509 [Phytophthora fragariae]KAE9240484.1 hypothetical protein PF004_g7485 [Phytophthora fragariae]
MLWGCVCCAWPSSSSYAAPKSQREAQLSSGLRYATKMSLSRTKADNRRICLL